MLFSDNTVKSKPRQYLRDNTDLSNEKALDPNGVVAEQPGSGKDGAEGDISAKDNAAGDVTAKDGVDGDITAKDNAAGDISAKDDAAGDITAKDDAAGDIPAKDGDAGDSVGPNDVAENDAAENGEQDKGDKEENVLDGQNADENNPSHLKMSKCWFPIKSQEHYREMQKLDRRYQSVRLKQGIMSTKKFDKEMLNAMLKTRTIAERALQHFGGDPNLIPAGLNLGGYCMMRMPQSVLFFHRLKLRNNTRFRINYLHNDLQEMILTARLSLNDLHLLGEYERALTYDDSPSTLYYTPTYGNLEFLLKNVQYKVEGRYRLLNDRLYIEHIISELHPKSILMRYMKDKNTTSATTVRLQEDSLDHYLQRIRNDLDSWLKDFFNDFLIYFNLPKSKTKTEVQEYENQKTIARNRFADIVVEMVRKRLRAVNASNVMIPSFTIRTVDEMEIKLYDGVVRGLDSIYRRSVTTGKLGLNRVRHLDAIVGFSSLKVEYKYEIRLQDGLPPLFGLVVRDADEQTGRMALRFVRDSPTLDMHFVMQPPISEARVLVVEGPANRYIAKYRHILENQIMAIMSSTKIHYMQQLDSLSRCNSLLVGKDDPNYKTIDDNDSEEGEQTQLDNEKEQTDVGGDVTPKPEDKPNTDDIQNTDDIPNIEDNPTANAPDAADEGPANPEHLPAPDYEVSRKESMELEFPPKAGAEKGEKMLLKVDETFSLTRLNKTERRTG